MRGTFDSIEDHVLGVAALIERLGATIRGDDDLQLVEDRAGGLTYELVADLPDGLEPARAEIVVREAFTPEGRQAYVRAHYEYELLDHSRDFRRAFHLHTPDWFRRHHLVIVHEHCERPIGAIDCPHSFGSPIRDASAGVLALIDAWTDEPPDCSALQCLE